MEYGCKLSELAQLNMDFVLEQLFLIFLVFILFEFCQPKLNLN